MKKHKRITFQIPDTPQMRKAMEVWEKWIKSIDMTRDQAITDWICFMSKNHVESAPANSAPKIDLSKCRHEHLVLCDCGSPYCQDCGREWSPPLNEAATPELKAMIPAYA